MGDPQEKERRVLRLVIDGLNNLDADSRARILRTAQTFFGLDAPTSASNTSHRPAHAAEPRDQGAPTFSTRTELSPKEFIFQKKPMTDIERVGCLAYYLTYYRSMPHFKTVDISKLNTEAAQVKFSNAAYAVVNASNAGLLVPAGKGNKQLSAFGEQYVELLPDRDAIKTMSAGYRNRKRRRRSLKK